MIGFAGSQRRHRPNRQDDRRSKCRSRADWRRLHEGFFPACRRRTICTCRCQQRHQQGSRRSPQVVGQLQQRDRPVERCSQSRSHSSTSAPHGVDQSGTEEHPDRVSRSIRTAIKADLRRSKTMSGASAAKTWQTRSRRCRQQATDRFAENVQTRYTGCYQRAECGVEAHQRDAVDAANATSALTAYIRNTNARRSRKSCRYRRQADRRYPQRNEPHPPADQGDARTGTRPFMWSRRLRELLADAQAERALNWS